MALTPSSASRAALIKDGGAPLEQPAKKAKRRKTKTAKQKRRSRGQGPYSYTVTQAGAMIGLSRSASYRAVHSGQIPTIEVNGGWVVPKLRWDALLGIEAPQKAEEAVA
jgi:hypothetical protein